MYGLVDCNNFYVSCERVFNPSLRDKPVVVLSNNDGCIIARSNEAKTLGIPMGAPLHLYKKLIKQNKILVYSSNSGRNVFVTLIINCGENYGFLCMNCIMLKKYFMVGV